METYFIRHTWKLDIDDDTRRALWDARKIAIHYPWERGSTEQEDSRSLNPDDYDGPGNRNLRTLALMAEQGGYVCAVHHPYPDCMLGYVEPGSRIELFEGKWGSVWERQGHTAVLKTLDLTKVRIVSPLDQAVCLVGRPRQGYIDALAASRESH